VTPTDQPTAAEPTDVELYALRAYLKTGSARAAAAALGLAEQTVKNHLASIRSKLGVRKTIQAAYILHDRLVA
jgi:DNA-binding NarL/FixJ family response regulator